MPDVSANGGIIIVVAGTLLNAWPWFIVFTIIGAMGGVIVKCRRKLRFSSCKRRRLQFNSNTDTLTLYIAGARNLAVTFLHIKSSELRVIFSLEIWLPDIVECRRIISASCIVIRCRGRTVIDVKKREQLAQK